MKAQILSVSLLVLSLIFWQPTLAAESASNKEYSGVVLEKSGDWQARKGTEVHPLKLGDPIVDGAMLEQKPGTKAGTISVLLSSGLTIKCPDCPDCKKPLVLDGQGNDIWSQLKQAFSKLAPSNSQRLVPTMSRSASVQLLTEAVVPLKSNKLDLASVFVSLPEQTCWIKVQQLQNNQAAGYDSGPQKVTWKQGKPCSVEAKGVSPGLYRVSLLQIDGDHEPTGDHAWIIVADNNNYKSSLASFSKAKQQILSPGADSAVTKALLRAYLSVLAN